MGVHYYEHDGRYIAVTGESPKGFKGVLFVGRGGELDKIVEQAFAASQLNQMRAVARQHVPSEWLEALGYEDAPVKSRRPAYRTVTEDMPILDINGDLLDLMPVTRRIALPHVRTPEENRNLAVVIMLALAIFLFFVF